jgi:hypothetical protein
MTPIGKLRPRFGPQFTKGCADTETLKKLLHKLDKAPLAKLVAQEIGELEKVRRTTRVNEVRPMRVPDSIRRFLNRLGPTSSS